MVQSSTLNRIEQEKNRILKRFGPRRALRYIEDGWYEIAKSDNAGDAEILETLGCWRDELAELVADADFKLRTMPHEQRILTNQTHELEKIAAKEAPEYQ